MLRMTPPHVSSQLKRKIAASRALLEKALPHVAVPELREALTTILVTGDWDYKSCSSYMYDTVQYYSPRCRVSIDAEMVMYYTHQILRERSPIEAARINKHLTTVSKQLKQHIKTINEQNIRPTILAAEGS